MSTEILPSLTKDVTLGSAMGWVVYACRRFCSLFFAHVKRSLKSRNPRRTIWQNWPELWPPHKLPTSQLPNSTWVEEVGGGGGHPKDIVCWKSQLSGGTSTFYWNDCVDITTNASNFSARSEFLVSHGSVYSLTGGIFRSSCKQFVTTKTLVCLSVMTVTYQSGPKIWSHLICYCFSVLLAKRYYHALIETSCLDLGVKRVSFVYCSVCN